MHFFLAQAPSAIELSNNVYFQSIEASAKQIVLFSESAAAALWCLFGLGLVVVFALAWSVKG